jgi:hypothetical protein
MDVYLHEKFIRSNSNSQQRGKTVGIAKFGVNPNVISNIWGRQTWANETRYLWAETDKPTNMKSSLPTFAEVVRSGAYCSRKNHQPTASFLAPCRPALDAQYLSPAPIPPPSLPAAMPPICEVWALGSTCDGSCGVCGAASGAARAAGSAMAARDDPFHFDWAHW